MLLEKIVNVLFPDKYYKKIKLQYRKTRKKILPKLTEEQFRKTLQEKLNVKKGAVVFIHSSLANLNLSFPPQKVLNILLDEVGEDGTLLMPCNHLKVRAEEYLRSGGIFNVRKTPTVMGLLPELVRRHKRSYRSLHPTVSVVAIGKYAKELTETHHKSIYPFGEDSPYYKIINYNGIIIGLGLETGQCLSFIHCTEDILKDDFPVKIQLDEIFIGKTIDYQGNELQIETLASHPNSGHRDITPYIKKYIPDEICKDMKIKGVSFFTARSKDLLIEMNELALKGITIYPGKVYK